MSSSPSATSESARISLRAHTRPPLPRYLHPAVLHAVAIVGAVIVTSWGHDRLIT